MRKYWTNVEIELLKEKYATDGEVALGILLKRTPIAIRHKANRLGLKKEPNVNENYFNKWSVNMAYTLGYIWADGSINKYVLKFRCNSKDENMLLAILKDMDCKCIIFRSPGYKSSAGLNIGPTTNCNIGNVKVIKSLMTLGLRQRKSYLNLEFPYVPPKYLPHFIRGHFDGDGSIYLKKNKYHTVVLLGTEHFAKRMQDVICSTIKINKLPLQINNKLYRLTWGHREDVRTFAKWIYPKGNYISLERKRKKLESVFLLPKKKSPTTKQAHNAFPLPKPNAPSL